LSERGESMRQDRREKTEEKAENKREGGER
jgi:hypothetical protein